MGTETEAPHTVLIVDDNAGIRNTMARILEMSGYVVVTAANGQEALAWLAGGAPVCLILLDLRMPVMDGAEFLRLKGADPALTRIPVLVMSALATLEEPFGTLDVVGCVDKPVDLEYLLVMVHRHCAGR